MIYSIKKKSSILWKTGVTEDQIYLKVKSLGDKVNDWEVCPLGDRNKAVTLSEFSKLKEYLIAQKKESAKIVDPQLILQNNLTSHQTNYVGIKNQTLAKLILSGIALSIFSIILLRISDNISGFAISLYVISFVLNLVLTVWSIVRLWNIDSMIEINAKPKTEPKESSKESNLEERIETIEDKLRKSKKLYEEGLLTNEAYTKLNIDLAQKL